MRQKRYDPLLLTALTIVALVALGLLIAATFLTKTEITAEATASKAQTTPVLSNLAAAPTTPTTVAAGSNPNINLTVPTGAIGDIIPLPAQLSTTGDVVVRRSAQPAKLSLDEVLGAIDNPWARGGKADNGLAITVNITFGLVTVGHRGSDGQWYGLANIAEFSCTAVRQCTKTGKLLDHVENRPIWVLDYKNLITFGTGTSYNHTVYLVDDATGQFFYLWGYNE
jgi:hypothetical protein